MIVATNIYIDFNQNIKILKGELGHYFKNLTIYKYNKHTRRYWKLINTALDTRQCIGIYWHWLFAFMIIVREV